MEKKKFIVHFKRAVKPGNYILGQSTAQETIEDFMNALEKKKFIYLGTRYYAVEAIEYIEFEGEPVRL